MNIARGLVIVTACLATTATGCAAATELPEPKGKTHAADELEQSGGGGAAVDPNTIFLKVDGRNVTYPNYDGNATHVVVCENGIDAATLDQIKNLRGQPHLVLQNQDGTYDTRLAESPLREENTYWCTGGKYGGTSYTFQLWQQDAGFLKHLDLSGAFISGFSGKNVGCEGGFQLSQGLGLDVKGFKVVNGALKQPEITLSLDGQSTGQGQFRCFLKASSGPKLVFAGPVPIVYELQITFGLQVSVSKATTIHASVGTNGGSLATDDPSFTITPQLELGVTFYGLIGGYVGVDMPISVTPHPPCTPEVKLGVQLKAGLQAGLLGFGELPISKAIQVEVSTPALGPFTLAASQCN